MSRDIQLGGSVFFFLEKNRNGSSFSCACPEASIRLKAAQSLCSVVSRGANWRPGVPAIHAFLAQVRAPAELDIVHPSSPNPLVASILQARDPETVPHFSSRVISRTITKQLGKEEQRGIETGGGGGGGHFLGLGG